MENSRSDLSHETRRTAIGSKMDKKKEEKKRIADERQIVVFTIGKEEFGVNINKVKEIIRMEGITKIPNTPEYIKGIINLRGGVIVVIDLSAKLGLPGKEHDKNTRIIVIEMGEDTIGMIVDSATEVMRLNSDQIEPAPGVITEKINGNYIEGVGILGERLLILLDLVKVLSDREFKQIRDVKAQSSENNAEAKIEESSMA